MTFNNRDEFVSYRRLEERTHYQFFMSSLTTTLKKIFHAVAKQPLQEAVKKDDEIAFKINK